MSKFCMQCGKQIGDGDAHCQYCGAAQNNSFEAKSSSEPKKSSGLLVPVVAVVALILVVVIVVLNLTLFNNGYKEPIDNLMEAISSGDVDYLEEALPDYIVDSDDYDADQMEGALKLMSALDDLDISYDVIDKEEIAESKLKKLEESIEEDYDESVDVDNGYDVKLEITVEYKGVEKSTETSISVYEIDGDWCITSHDMKGIGSLLG